MHRGSKRRYGDGALGLSASTWIVCILAFCAGFFVVTRSLYHSHTVDNSFASSLPSTLVVYSYRNTDPEAVSNLQFFLKNVITLRDTARYIIVVDHGLDQYGEFHSAVLPDLPSNAQYVSVRACFELGHVGMVFSGLTKAEVNLQQYQYFVWLDSTVRGPFMPSYVSRSADPPAWHSFLTSRLSDTVKLVGATISCTPVSLPKVRVSGSNAIRTFAIKVSDMCVMHVYAYLHLTTLSASYAHLAQVQTSSRVAAC